MMLGFQANDVTQVYAMFKLCNSSVLHTAGDFVVQMFCNTPLV